MGNKMLFGIYHTDCRKNVERFEQLVSSDFINTFLIEGDIDDEYFSMNFELSKFLDQRGKSRIPSRKNCGGRRG